MSKVALAGALVLLMFFSYLTGIKSAFVFGYALSLLFLVAWAWPRLAIRGVTLQRRVDPGTPTVGEVYEEEFEVRRKGWIPAPWVEVRDLIQIADYQPGRVISLGGEIVKWRARGVYRRRGWMALGPTSLRVREPFGLFDRELKVTQRTSILVYPRVRPVPDLMTPSSQQVGTSQSLGAWADYPAVCQADGRNPLTQTLAWDRIRRLPRRAIAVITPSADPEWVRLLQAVRGRRSTLIVFYLDVASFGGPDQNPSFDLGQDVDLYVVRKGDDFARLVRTRDAIRIA